MGRVAVKRQPSRSAKARAGYFAGLLLAAAGLGWALGWGWGVLLAGVGVIAYFVLLYDVDEPETVREDGPW